MSVLDKMIESIDPKTIKMEKMSKSRGNVVTVDEVTCGIQELQSGCDLRDENGEVVHRWKELGAWRDPANRGYIYTATRYGKHPLFLCPQEDPIPFTFTPTRFCPFSTEQHEDRQDIWRRFAKMFDFTITYEVSQ